MSVPPEFFARYATIAMAKTQRRRHGRVFCQEVCSTLGEVIDLSASGMRVLTTSRPPKTGSFIHSTLQCSEGAILLTGLVVWSRRVGLFRFEVGIEFKGLTPQLKQTLTYIARAAAQNETVLPSIERMRNLP